MFHIVAYRASIADSTLAELAAVNDNIMTIQNNHILPQEDMQVFWAYVGGANVQRLRLNTPFLRQVTPTWIIPVSTALVPPTRPAVAFYFNNPLKLRALEEIAVEAFQNSGGAQVNCLIAAIGPRTEPIPPGPIYVLRGTATTTLTANAWTPIGAITWDTVLPQGRYAVVGLEVQGATLQSMRMTFDGQFYRPGVLGKVAITDQNHQYFYDRRMGKLGEFTTTNFPRFEAIATAADTAQEIRMELVKLG